MMCMCCTLHPRPPLLGLQVTPADAAHRACSTASSPGQQWPLPRPCSQALHAAAQRASLAFTAHSPSTLATHCRHSMLQPHTAHAQAQHAAAVHAGLAVRAHSAPVWGLPDRAGGQQAGRQWHAGGAGVPRACGHWPLLAGQRPGLQHLGGMACQLCKIERPTLQAEACRQVWQHGTQHKVPLVR